MNKFLKKNIYLMLIFATSFIIFFRSLFVFYTNDDFFHLNIANVGTLRGFFNFFSLINPPQGWSFYRPLTTQVFYFIGEKFFNFNPFGLHLISFLFFFGTIYLVYQLSLSLFVASKSKIVNRAALMAAFLYAVSATHFGHLYFLGAFQELGMTLFVLLSCLSFIKEKRVLSFVFFVLALMSKETAVITPILLALIYFYQKYSGVKVVSFKKLLVYLLPFAICLIAYLFIRFYSYGFVTGDSYVWDFSVKRLVNTLAWYFAWSFNLPEMLVDFVGPGFHLNPNLLKYWSKEIIPTFILFAIQIFFVVYTFLKSRIFNHKSVLLFCISWFLISILPVAFLPVHKFTFYLTLPLVGVVFLLSYLVINLKSKIYILFGIVWLTLSILTLRLTYQTNWITQSEIVADKAYQYFKLNSQILSGKDIYFIDTTKDLNLPWSPTATLKTVLSDKNFFDVFYPNLSVKIYYAGLANISKTKGVQLVESRQFLGY